MKKAKEINFFTLLTDFAVLCKRVNAFCYTLWLWIGECFQCFFPVWGKEEGHFPTCFQSAPFPGFKNHEMTEVTCRLMGLSQPKSTYVLVRASGWDDWNSFFRILWLLNAESFVKDFWLNSDLSKEKNPTSFIEALFIYSCFSGNEGTRRRYAIAQIELLSKLQTICGPAAWILLSLDAHTLDWMLLWTN